jgi:Skp family chaperone for outer membrane proteins
MNSRMTAWAGIVLGAISLMAWTKTASADDAAPATKVAACNPMKVISQVQEGKDAMAKWKQDGETLNNQATVKKGQLQTEQDEIKLLLPTSDEFEKKVEKLTEDQADYQAWAQSAQVNLARKQQQEERALFDKVLKTVSNLAQAQGFTVVINGAFADFPDIAHMDANSFVQTILLHNCLYVDPKLDITQQVIIAMDKAYSTSH